MKNFILILYLILIYNISFSEVINLNSGNSVDDNTNILKTISIEHSKIHDGYHFYVCNFSNLNDNGTVIYTVITPNSKTWSHMTFNVQAIKGFDFEVYRSPTITVTGTSVTPNNNNENSSIESTLTLRTGDTASPSGTLLQAFSTGATANPTALNIGSIIRSKEIILRQNTTYLFKMTSNADSNTISYCGDWYENINKK